MDEWQKKFIVSTNFYISFIMAGANSVNSWYLPTIPSSICHDHIKMFFVSTAFLPSFIMAAGQNVSPFDSYMYSFNRQPGPKWTVNVKVMVKVKFKIGLSWLKRLNYVKLKNELCQVSPYAHTTTLIPQPTQHACKGKGKGRRSGWLWEAKEWVMPCATILRKLLTTSHTRPTLPILHLGYSWTKLALES
jgi:hypothetical protein